MPAIFSHLSAQECFRLLAFGKTLQLKAMDIAIKPVGADDPKQPVRVALRLSPTLVLPTQPAHVRQHKGRIRALFAPGGSATRVRGRPAKWVPASGPAPHGRASAAESTQECWR